MGDYRWTCAIPALNSQLHLNILCSMYGKFMLWKMWCFAQQSMGHTNHKFPVYAKWNATDINVNMHSIGRIVNTIEVLSLFNYQACSLKA